MKILVVVAINQVRTLMTEVDNVSARSVFLRGLVGPKLQINFVKQWDWSIKQRKGNRINIPILSIMYFNGDVNEHEDASRYPEKSYLFLLTGIIIEECGIKLIGEASLNPGKAIRLLWICSVHTDWPLKTRGSDLSLIENRTDNRIRYPRLVASGLVD